MPLTAMLAEPPIALPAASPRAWYRPDLDADAVRLAIPAEAIDEIERALPEVDAGGVELVPAIVRSGRLTATAGLIAEARSRVLSGPGLVLAGRLPMERWSTRQRRAAVAVLAGVMGPLVRQTHHTDTKLYDVRDTGKRPGPGVRRSITNASQPFHTDGPWVARPPWIVGLFCLEAAENGGVSQCLSLRALFDDLEHDLPGSEERLRSDFYWDRQREHAACDSLVSRFPILWQERGCWSARLYADYVLKGYELAGSTIDPDTRKMLDRMATLTGDPRRQLEFTLAPGEIEWVNNRVCAHARTGFEPTTRDRRQRHLVRTWHRLDGGTSLDE